MNNHLAEQFNNQQLFGDSVNSLPKFFPNIAVGSFSSPSGSVNISTEPFGMFRTVEGSNDLMPILSGDDVGGTYGSPTSSPGMLTPHRVSSPDNNTQNTLCERSQALIKIEDPQETNINTLNPESVWSIFPYQLPQSPKGTSSIASTPQDQSAAKNHFKFDISEEREGVSNVDISS